MNITRWPNSYKLNGTLSFTCPANMTTQTFNTTQNLTCSSVVTAKKTNYTFIPSVVEPCDVCLGAPLVSNATADWSANTMYLNGSQVNATCLPGYQVEFGVTSLLIDCTESGWSQAPPCYLACVDDPVAPPNTTWNITYNNVGSTIPYTCPTGEFMVLNGSTSLLNETTVTCGVDGLWNPASLPPCAYYCVGEPLVANATTDWLSTAVYTLGDTVNVTCLHAFMLDDSISLNVTQLLICNQSGWSLPTPCQKGCSEAPPQPGANMTHEVMRTRALGSSLQYMCYPDQLMVLNESQVVGNVTEVRCGEDGLWHPPAPLPSCGVPTDQPPVMLPVNAGVLVGPDPPYTITSTLTYSCSPGFVSFTGLLETNITYNGTDWVMDDASFRCLAATNQTPVVLPVNAGVLVGPDPPYIVNSTFTYSCASGFVSLMGVPSTNITYNGTDWVMEDTSFSCVAGKYKESSREYTYDWIRVTDDLLG
nr:complement factor H-like [Procambarus clarkii]